MSSADPALTGFPRAESDASRALRRWLVHLDDLQLVATARTDPTAIARPVLHHHGRSSGPSDDPSR